MISGISFRICSRMSTHHVPDPDPGGYEVWEWSSVPRLWGSRIVVVEPESIKLVTPKHQTSNRNLWLIILPHTPLFHSEQGSFINDGFGCLPSSRTKSLHHFLQGKFILEDISSSLPRRKICTVYPRGCLSGRMFVFIPEDVYIYPGECFFRRSLDLTDVCVYPGRCLSRRTCKSASGSQSPRRSRPPAEPSVITTITQRTGKSWSGSRSLWRSRPSAETLIITPDGRVNLGRVVNPYDVLDHQPKLL